ncbi:sugar phosphate isomerase/epimerase [Pseudomonas sp. dw_358]|uniref:sugar phosphate isomerase/epimerase n=1 Tax=Pseudomonas sp. dw_358 TaxID=2720083 RepID=UPI001BD5482B|nr:sugar phosphate isomerase/epimerase [Pseudomonas sp. dw_358]
MSDTLEIFQALWGMERLGTGGEPSLEANLDRIQQAGFSGITALYESPAHAERLTALRHERGLQLEAQAQPRQLGDLAPALELIARHDCHHVTVQVDMRPYTLGEAMHIVESWLPLFEQFDFPVLLETHRQRLTNDLPLTVHLLKAFPQLKLLADLSHYVVSREMPDDPDARDREAIAMVLEHAHGFHGRYASAEQVQVPLGYPQHAGYYALFHQWWLAGFESFRRRLPGHPEHQRRTLSFTCELGPAPYAITDRHGHELSDRWEEALILKHLGEDLWRRACLTHP